VLSLSSAEDQVRTFTRHQNDTVRLTQSTVRRLLHQNYRWLRTWLQDVAPSLYLCQSDEITLVPPQEIHLESLQGAFERIYRVERKDASDNWRGVELAATSDPHRHVTGSVTFREESGCLKFGPDDRYEGTYRVHYHFTPSGLVDDASTFRIPSHLDLPLIFSTCALVAVADGDDPASYDTRAQGYLATAKVALGGREGAHQRREGLQRAMGRW